MTSTPKNAGRISILLVLGLWSLCILSCKKPVDDIPPQITVNFPSDGASYDVLDTVVISVDVSDNEGVRLVLTELITIDGQLVLPSMQAAVCSDNANLTYGFPLADVHIDSGTYYLRISAEDSEQKKTAFVEIQLFEVPLSLDHFYWIDDNGSDALLQQRTILEPDVLSIASVPSGLTRLYPDRWNQRMVLSNSSGSHLQFMDVEEGQDLGEVIIPIAFEGTHAGFFDYQDRLFYSAASGDLLRVFRTNGTQINGIPFPADIEVSALGALENEILLAGTFNDNHFVFFLNRSSGALLHTVGFDFPITALLAVPETNKVYVYSDNSGETLCSQINGMDGVTAMDFNPDSPVANVVKRDATSSDFVVALEDGRVFLQNPSQVNDPGTELQNFILPPYMLASDLTNDQLFFARAEFIFVQALNGSENIGIQNTTTNAEPWVALMYNK